DDPRGAALEPGGGVPVGVLEGPLGHGGPLETDGQPGGVHHGEHGGHPTVEVADQLALGGFVGHDAGGAAVEAELLLDADAVDGVAGTEGAVGADEEFGDHEEGQSPGPGWGAGRPGEDQVDDVVGQVVVAPGDEDLGAGDPPPVAVLLGPGPDLAHVGPG